MKIALDDFGSGYANFGYLVDIPFDKLKIDRSVNMRILDAERSRVVMAGLGETARCLGMTVTVEGIETREQLEAVLACANIDEVQGWVFSKALPAADFASLLADMAAERTTGHPRKMAATAGAR